MRQPEVPVGAVCRVDEQRRRRCHGHTAKRPVRDPFPEDGLDRRDEPGPRVTGLVEEARVGLVVEADEEPEMALARVADGAQPAAQAHGRGRGDRARSRDRVAKVLLVRLPEQCKDLLTSKPMTMECHP